MRVLACVLTIVALAGVARADDDDTDEDGAFMPVPKRSIAVAFGGHGTRIGGLSEGGVGPTLELALGSGRWQYFTEGGFATSSVSTSTTNPDASIGGRMLHAGGGLRWLARQFRPDTSGGVELFLVSRLGYERFYLDDGTRLGRPELGFGFGLQGRLYKKPRLAFRLDFRALFTPADTDSTLAVCRGRCMTETANTGFSTGVAIVW